VKFFLILSYKNLSKNHHVINRTYNENIINWGKIDLIINILMVCFKGRGLCILYFLIKRNVVVLFIDNSRHLIKTIPQGIKKYTEFNYLAQCSVYFF